MTWSSDTPISMPVPHPDPILVKFKGFGFTAHGIAHTITDQELETLHTPVMMPIDFTDDDRGPDAR